MNKIETEISLYLLHLEDIINLYNSNYDSFNSEPLSSHDAIRIITRSRNLVQKIAGKDSSYVEELDLIYREDSHNVYKAEAIIGVLLGLKDELRIGNLNSISELIRGEIFDSFLEMAEHLSNEKYKDAAAVIAASSLETHLKQLAKKYHIDIEIIQPGSKPKYKKAETINQDLGKAKVYSAFDQKQITAWLDLRNNAAHGKYSSYSENEVIRFIEWLKDFISKNSA